MMTESELFVWEIAGDWSRTHIADPLRERMRKALHRARAPLRTAALVIGAAAYGLPFVLLLEPLQEAFSTNGASGTHLAQLILLGISTIVVSPIFGLIVQARREASALLDACRTFAGRVVALEDENFYRLSMSTHQEELTLSVPRSAGSMLPGQIVTVYAVPEEADLVVVEVSAGGSDNLWVGQIER